MLPRLDYRTAGIPGLIHSETSRFAHLWHTWRMRIVPQVMLLAALSACATKPSTPTTIKLFNGTDLTGWHADVPDADKDADISPSFSVWEGLLLSNGSPQGHLISDETYSNYELIVEYRWPGKGGNCGVLVHASTPRMLYGMFPQSIECQMHAGNAGDFWCIGEDIKVDNMAERRGGDPSNWGGQEGQERHIWNLTDDSEKPLGEWNTMRIVCKDDTINIWVNDDHVMSGFECTASSGAVALQAEGTPCEFRRVDLTPLQ
jgi:hypothetical protein